MPKPEIEKRVKEMLELVKLEQFSKRKPDQLSGGQRQRVALARALAKRPRILLLDEPLGALDKKLRGEMQLELKRLQSEFGITFVVVTHDQEEALVMADRIAILKDGRAGAMRHPARDLRASRPTRFAADFIGVMNFLPARVAAAWHSTADGAAITLRAGAPPTGDGDGRRRGDPARTAALLIRRRDRDNR